MPSKGVLVVGAPDQIEAMLRSSTPMEVMPRMTSRPMLTVRRGSNRSTPCEEIAAGRRGRQAMEMSAQASAMTRSQAHEA